MKFKNIFFSLLGGMLIGACTPDDADVYLNPVKPADIKILELMADHETLLPDGEAEMNFRIMAYGIKEIKVMKKYETSDSLSYTEVLDKIGLIPEITVRYRSPYFGHIFNGGYSAGYYAYTWAEVLDADAFSVFKQQGIYDQATAESFRKNILEKGGSEHPMILYKRFRGQEPTIDALLERSGLKSKSE